MDRFTLGYKDKILKILQETAEEKWKFTSFAHMEGIVRRVDNPREIFLLLHGLGERGKRIYRKLLPYLPKDALVIAPNGPFPIPRQKEGRMDYGHAWYFYDKTEGKYFLNQDLARFWLRDLIKIENPKALPVTIIGFSQGGYLAPLAGMTISETKLVIGLGCEFRSTLIQNKPAFPMHAIHGDRDEIIPMNMGQNEIKKLSEHGIHVEWHLVTNTGHEISNGMGIAVKSILEKYGKRSL